MQRDGRGLLAAQRRALLWVPEPGWKRRCVRGLEERVRFVAGNSVAGESAEASARTGYAGEAATEDTGEAV